MKMSPARQREHVDTCARTRQDTTKTAEWAAAHGVNLDDLDGHSQSLDVVGVPDTLTDAPVNFTSNAFRFDDGMDDLETFYRVTGSNAALAVIDERHREMGSANRVAQLATLTRKTRRQNERRVGDGRRLLVDYARIAINLEVAPADVVAALRGQPDELQFAVAAKAQREADLKTIEQAIAASQRTKRLSHGVLDVLDRIGRNTPQTRRRLAPLTKVEQVEALADLVAEWRKECRRIRARDWEKQRRFERARETQQHDTAVEALRLWRSLPEDNRFSVAAEISRDIDTEALQ